MMLFPIDTIISFISRYFTLKTGDIIFTGTPAGVAAVKVGDTLSAFIEGEKMLEFEVK
jgi:2-keto-4-pentenoate hydratase/2-oxohepta-3-ene-1,7-dioic acid hydratase in catechol pathway